MSELKTMLKHQSKLHHAQLARGLGKLFDSAVDEIESLESQLKQANEIIKAVAHIGIDWGYGKYELEQEFIDKARVIYEANEELQNPTIQPPVRKQ